jgi:hypothetical protein
METTAAGRRQAVRSLLDEHPSVHFHLLAREREWLAEGLTEAQARLVIAARYRGTHVGQRVGARTPEKTLQALWERGLANASGFLTPAGERLATLLITPTEKEHHSR